jgi:SHAQKYF class myb-like DNA-binding protein
MLGARKRRRGKEIAEFDAKFFRPELDKFLYDISLPKEHESDILAAIFELGLRSSSPKVLMSLMPDHYGTNSEHIKSHLQKYRLIEDKLSTQVISSCIGFTMSGVRKSFSCFMRSTFEKHSMNGKEERVGELSLTLLKRMMSRSYLR